MELGIRHMRQGVRAVGMQGAPAFKLQQKAAEVQSLVDTQRTLPWSAQTKLLLMRASLTVLVYVQ